MDPIEKQTIIRAQKGEKDAFSNLYDKYLRKIYDFIYYKTHHTETAEDITSIVFMKAWKSIGTFKGEYFSAWLYCIARNAVIDHYRTSRAHSNIDDAWDLSNNEDVSADADTKLKVQNIQEYIKKLSSTERDILIMRIWQDMPYKEIAEIINKSEGNCKVIFGRTIKKLKEQMPSAAFMALVLNLYG